MDSCVACTLVMKGDSYVVGALTLAYSWHKHNSTKIICMVTHDVSKDAVEALETVFDRVVLVPYIKYTGRWLAYGRMLELYKDWIDVACTKWNIFNMVEYKLVYFIDADEVVLENCDDVFSLKPPAGIMRSAYYSPKNIEPGDHGSIVSYKVLARSLMIAGNCIGGANVLIAPSESLYKDMLDIVANKATLSRSGGVDEVVLSLVAIKNKMDITNIAPSYGWYCGKKDYLMDLEAIVFHFYHDKPWDKRAIRWPDWKVFEDNFDGCIRDHPSLRKWDYRL